MSPQMKSHHAGTTAVMPVLYCWRELTLAQRSATGDRVMATVGAHTCRMGRESALASERAGGPGHGLPEAENDDGASFTNAEPAEPHAALRMLLPSWLMVEYSAHLRHKDGSSRESSQRAMTKMID